jgi:hypothetical protein
MKHDLIRMSAHQVLTAIHRGENALINVEGPHGRHVDGKRTWKALASHTVDGLLSCTRLAPWLVGEQWRLHCRPPFDLSSAQQMG